MHGVNFTVTFDLSLATSNQCILDSKWMFVSNAMTFPQYFSGKYCICKVGMDGQTTMYRYASMAPYTCMDQYLARGIMGCLSVYLCVNSSLMNSNVSLLFNLFSWQTFITECPSLVSTNPVMDTVGYK